MKGFMIVSAASLATLFATGALAADLGGSIKDGGFVEQATPIWGGVYIGGSIGYGNANHELSLNRYNESYCFDEPVQPSDAYGEAVTPGDHYAIPADGICKGSGTDLIDSNLVGDVTVPASSQNLANLDGLNSSGLVGDVRLGYDFAPGGRFLVGIFGAYGLSDMETTASIAGLGNAWIEKGDEWSIGARAGLLVNPRTLAYIMAAYTQTDYEFGVSNGQSSASTEVEFSGVTVGGGIEFAVTNNIFLGIEGSHTFYGNETLLKTNEGVDGAVAGHELEDDLGETKVMGTLKIKLNNGLFAN